MITADLLIRDLKNIGINPRGALFLHTSLKKIGCDGETVLDALMEYMKDGLLVLPCHTWSNINDENPIFDVRNTKPCIGTLPDLFRKRENVYRSLHPTHSVCAFGRDAEAFVQGQEKFNTPCAPESCYGKLIERNAEVLLIGVSFACNTSVHCIEEIARVPNRIGTAVSPLKVIDLNGNTIDCPSYRHQNANSDLYVKLQPVMEEQHTLKTVKFGNADTLYFKERDLCGVTLSLLNKNIDLFGNDKPVPEEWYKKQ